MTITEFSRALLLAALKRVAGRGPVGQATFIAANVGVAGGHEPPIGVVTGNARLVGALDEDLCVLVGERFDRLLRSMKVNRTRDVLSSKGPVVAGHDQCEVIPSIQLGLEVFTVDRSNVAHGRQGQLGGPF